MAIALDVPQVSVFVHDRNLAVAGLRTKGGRGSSAAKVTPRDAARLFVAVFTSAKAKDSAETVQAFERLTWSNSYMFRPNDVSYAPAISVPYDPAISSLPLDHSFVDA